MGHMENRYKESIKWLDRAKRVIPSASQTYSKSYRYYCEGAAPAFIDHGLGSHVWDVDGNEYVDFVLALGPITLGHNDTAINAAIANQLEKGIIFSQPVTLEVELAEKLSKIIPCAEMVRFVKNGSDATTVAIRLARAYSGKDLVLSCGYHGMHDWYIGSTENNLGVPDCVQKMIKTFPYNDLDALEKLILEYRDQIAAIILEPVRVEEPEEGYLQGVRMLADKYGIILIFDEVVTGFRIALEGAQGYYGVTPDIAAFGKGMGNGMPISAVVGKADIMNLADNGAFVSLTFGGEALSLAAGLATIDELTKRDVFKHTRRLGQQLKDSAQKLVSDYDLNDIVTIKGTSVMPGLFFNPCSGYSANDVMALFQQETFCEGVFFLGVNYLCASHTEADIVQAIKSYRRGLDAVKRIRDGIPLEKLLKGKSFRPIFSRNKH